MTMIPASAAASPTAPHALGHIPNPTAAIFQAAQRLLSNLDHGQRIDAPILRAAMEAAFGASDATGAWDWKSAYAACERSEEHTSELQSLMRRSYAVFCLK